MLAGVSVATTRVSSAATSTASPKGAGSARPRAAARRRRARALFDLARAAQSTSREPAAAKQKGVRPSVQRILDAMTGAPAFVRNERMDVLAANRLGRALFSEMFTEAVQPEHARFVYLDPAPRRSTSTGIGCRAIPSRSCAGPGATPTIATSPTSSDELVNPERTFRTRWAAHNVRYHDTGTKRFHHPVVGDLTLTYENMTLVGDPGLTMFAYTAEVGSKSEEALNLLASWTATQDQAAAESNQAAGPPGPDPAAGGLARRRSWWRAGVVSIC